MNGKFGDVIRKAKQSQQTSKPDNQITSKPDSQIASQVEEKMVNLCIRVPESRRRHWAAEAKRQGITMTEVISEALTQKFGLPDNQITR
jgi:predicted HicB family RNase H-like nuclease